MLTPHSALPPRPSELSASQPQHDTAKLDALISTQYQHCFKARVHCDYPHLLYITDPSGEQIQAAAGFRPAEQALYLEQYLALPAQHMLSNLYQRPIERGQLVEIGNFVGMSGPAAFALMHQLLSRLEQQGYQHVLLTCTRQLKRTFQGLPIAVLAKADPSRVPSTEHWGSYYQQGPEVISAPLSAYDQRFARLSRKHPHLCHYLNRQGLPHAL